MIYDKIRFIEENRYKFSVKDWYNELQTVSVKLPFTLTKSGKNHKVIYTQPFTIPENRLIIEEVKKETEDHQVVFFFKKRLPYTGYFEQMMFNHVKRDVIAQTKKDYIFACLLKEILTWNEDYLSGNAEFKHIPKNYNLNDYSKLKPDYYKNHQSIIIF